MQGKETLVEWKENLLKRIKAFEDECDVDSAKNVSEEEYSEFKKWRKKQKISNDTYINKLDKLIIESQKDEESSNEESEEESEEDSDGEREETSKENVNDSLVQCLKTLQISAQLPQRLPDKFDGSDITEFPSWSMIFEQTIEKKVL